jgi:hypothetical protein
MESRDKTRNQSLYEYLDALQLEFIQAELRRKIYPKPKDKRFWDRVLEHKEFKVKDIAQRNGLPCIFTDEKIREQYRLKIFNETGIPSFFYKDEYDRAEFEIKDFRYYFSAGSEVKVLVGNGEVSIGKVAANPIFGEDAVRIKFKGESEEYVTSINYVTRIL